MIKKQTAILIVFVFIISTLFSTPIFATSESYDGIFIKQNQIAGNILCDGGFESTFSWSANQFGFNNSYPSATYPDTMHNHISQTSDYYHSGDKSLKVEMAEQIVLPNGITSSGVLNGYSGVGFNLDLDKVGFNNANWYYLEAWVKIEDDFEGSIAAMFGDRSSRYELNYRRHLWMLGSDDVTESGGLLPDGWMLLRTPVIPLATLQSWVQNSNSLLVDFCIKGKGTVYVDDIDLKAVEADTAMPSVNWQHAAFSFQVLRLNANTDCDIYYTFDNTDPKTSLTSRLYDDNVPIVMTENTYVRCIAFNSNTGEYGNEVGSYYTNSGVPIDLAINGASATSVNTGYIPINSIIDYTLEFDLKASGLNGGTAGVKLFMVGAGISSLTVNGTKYTGGWVDRSGYIAQISTDGTHKIKYDVTNLLGYYRGMILVLETDSKTATVSIENGAAHGMQKYLPVVSVEEIDTPYLNYYTDEDISNGSIKKDISLKNNTRSTQSGMLSYKVISNTTSETVATSSLNVNIASDGLVESSIEIGGVGDYGVYTVEYIFTDEKGAEHNSGIYVFARIRDNSSKLSGSSSGITSHVMQWTAKSNEEYYEMFSSYAKYGIRYLRIDIRWDDVEKQKGIIEMEEHYYRIVNIARECGLKVIIVTNVFDNSLYNDSTFDVRNSAFTNFVKTVMQEFEFDYYECINEPNGKYFTISNSSSKTYLSGSYYAQILRSIYQNVDFGDIKIVAGNVSNHGGGYFEAMYAYDNKITECFDIWSVHPYSWNYNSTGGYETVLIKGTYSNNQWVTQNAYFSSLQKNYFNSAGITLWAGEFGYPVCEAVGCVSAEQAAALTVRAYIAMETLGVSNFGQYTVDGNHINYDSESSYGMLQTAKKEMSVAVNAYVDILSGYTQKEVISEGDNGIFVYRYSDGTKDAYVMWSAEGTNNYNVQLTKENYGLLDMYGNVLEQAEISENYLYSVEIGFNPVYLVPMKAVVAPPEYNNIENGDIEETFTEGISSAGTIKGDAYRDATNPYRGDFSLRVDSNGTESGADVTLVTKDSVMDNIDVNSRYRLRFKVRASEDFLGKLMMRCSAYYSSEKINSVLRYNNRYADSFYIYGFNGNLVSLTSLSTEWLTYTTPAFSVLGDEMRFTLFQRADSGSVWFDDFELIPADDVSQNHGTLTTAYDSESGKIIISAKAESGYKLDTLSIKGGVNKSPWVITEMPYELCAKPYVNEECYEFSFNVNGELFEVYTFDSIKLFTATFKKNVATMLGNCNYDNIVDVRDLVRLKKYKACDELNIELVNVDFDADNEITASDLSQLKRLLLK